MVALRALLLEIVKSVSNKTEAQIVSMLNGLLFDEMLSFAEAMDSS